MVPSFMGGLKGALKEVALELVFHSQNRPPVDVSGTTHSDKISPPTTTLLLLLLLLLHENGFTSGDCIHTQK